MWREFREFLVKQNALALAIGVIVGAAMGRVVSSVVADLLKRALLPSVQISLSVVPGQLLG